MPGNAFILFKNSDGTISTGSSMQSTHPSSAGWLEITDWNWDIEAETNFLKGTGASVGVATPGTFGFSHSFDRSSPNIMNYIVLGTAFKSVVLHMLKSTGAADGAPEVFFGFKIADAFITKVSSKAGEDGAITQDVEFVFKAIALGYKQQLNTGKLDATIRPFGWNVATKTTTAGFVVALDPKKDLS